jgi:hypothetical protein
MADAIIATNSPEAQAPRRRNGRDDGWCYLIGYGEGEPFKVGRTYSIENRLNNLQSGNHRELVVLIGFESRIPHCAEQQLQERFAPYRIRGEWFDWNDDVADIIARMRRKNTRLLRKLYWTGNLRHADRYDRCAKEIAYLASIGR